MSFLHMVWHILFNHLMSDRLTEVQYTKLFIQLNDLFVHGTILLHANWYNWILGLMFVNFILHTFYVCNMSFLDIECVSHHLVVHMMCFSFLHIAFPHFVVVSLLEHVCYLVYYNIGVNVVTHRYKWTRTNGSLTTCLMCLFQRLHRIVTNKFGRWNINHYWVFIRIWLPYSHCEVVIVFITFLCYRLSCWITFLDGKICNVRLSFLQSRFILSFSFKYSLCLMFYSISAILWELMGWLAFKIAFTLVSYVLQSLGWQQKLLWSKFWPIFWTDIWETLISNEEYRLGCFFWISCASVQMGWFSLFYKHCRIACTVFIITCFCRFIVNFLCFYSIHDLTFSLRWYLWRHNSCSFG